MADIVIGSLGGRAAGAQAEEFEAIVRERRYRPIFMIDLGVPRNFDERINALENVYLYDIDDLGAVVAESLGDREREADKAEAIVAESSTRSCAGSTGSNWSRRSRTSASSIEQLRDDELGTSSRMARRARAGGARSGSRR